MQTKTERSETRLFKAVFPNTTNHYNTLFGGAAISFMVEAAFITATRFARKKMVTVSSEKIEFAKPIPSGTLIELIGKVISVGNSSIKVHVEVFIEQMYSEHRELGVSGIFTLVALDENKQPVSIHDEYFP